MFDGDGGVDVEFWTAAWKATRCEMVQGVFSRRGVQRLVLDWRGDEGEVGRAEVEVERARSAVVRRMSMSFGAREACEVFVDVRGCGVVLLRLALLDGYAGM